MKEMTIQEKCINTIRCLAMDAVQKADSGHPGTPMALAPAAYVLWMEHLRYHPRNPQWFNRDRFILSNGHASLLQYAVLYLTGYDISLEDIQNFRQWGSITAGHPEYDLTPGVETTTGPLGQGFMNAVGMAIAEAHLAAVFNRPDFPVIDHHTYTFCSDGDLMEGASHEAASLAGHLGLGKLICLYDDNHITIEGDTNITYTEDVAGRFSAYRWHVQDLGEKGNDLDAISEAFKKAKAVTDQPSLIILRTHIAYGAPNKQDTPEAHGSPLGEEEVKKTKAFYGWPEEEKFLVPEEVKSHMGRALDRGKELEQRWQNLLDDYGQAHARLREDLMHYRKRELVPDWDQDIPHYEPSDGPMATRAVSHDVINAIAPKLPWLVGGSADLEPSTKTLMDSSAYFEKGQYQNRNLAWGVREHVMCAASSGIYLHGGLRPFTATFFIFSDYARPAIRLASLMELPIIYVMTHDSIGLGEDGPTHQPVEQLASFRAMPNMCVIRPADANEAAYAWRAAVQRREGPTMLVLTRQKLPIFDRRSVAGAEGLYQGAYIISPEQGSTPDLILLASGSEVQLCLEAQKKLQKEEIDARVVSMPSWELFRQQAATYQQEVLPPHVRARLAVEAGAPTGWHEWIGTEGDLIAITEFGTSAPFRENFSHYGFTEEHIVSKCREMLVETS